MMIVQFAVFPFRFVFFFRRVWALACGMIYCFSCYDDRAVCSFSFSFCVLFSTSVRERERDAEIEASSLQGHAH